MILDNENCGAFSGKLLSTIRSGNQHEDVFSRAECSYSNKSEKFKNQSKDFTKQFAHIYAVRLVMMRNILDKRINKKWGSDIPVRKLIELKDDNEKCVIIGTLFKHQVLKPSILREICEENLLMPQPVRTNFIDNTDQLILEDEQQRIRLVGMLDVHVVVTGIVCAVLGKDSGDGKFIVDDYCWPGISEVVQRPLSSQDKKFIILISGLGIANNADSLLPLQLLVDWIGGMLGDVGDQKCQAQAVRIIIAGNSIRDCAGHRVPTLSNTFKLGSEDTLKATQLLDDFLIQLASCIEVDLMPGEFDPSNHMLPQQPLHFCMFPQASTYESMHGVSNPYECEVDGRRLLGSSGQPVHDIAHYSNLVDPLVILQQTLEWAHLAPTCPDTLSGYPYYQEDPFIISDCPDVFFAGNQPTFQSKMYEGPEGQHVRLICVPSFAKTHSCVVVDLATLECYPVCFGASGITDSEMEK